MPWSAKIMNVVVDEICDTMCINVLVESHDEQGLITGSYPEMWRYAMSEVPTAEQLAERLKTAASRKSNIKAKRDLILSLVDSPVVVSDTPPLFPVDFKAVSQTDQALIALKDQVKPLAMSFIKANPTCLTGDLYAYFAGIDMALAHMSLALCSIYQGGAAQAGLISQNTWEALRDWIVATPTEQILAL